MVLSTFSISVHLLGEELQEHVTAVGDEDLCFPTLENTARSFVCCHLGDFDTRFVFELCLLLFCDASFSCTHMCVYCECNVINMQFAPLAFLG